VEHIGLCKAYLSAGGAGWKEGGRVDDGSQWDGGKG